MGDFREIKIPFMRRRWCSDWISGSYPGPATGAKCMPTVRGKSGVNERVGSTMSCTRERVVGFHYCLSLPTIPCPGGQVWDREAFMGA
jgi:hypothetical protein